MPKLTKEQKLSNFWSRVDKQGPYPDPKKYPKLKTRCWVWTGVVDRDGYGIFEIQINDKQHTLAHRIAWLLRRKKLPKGKKVLHKCDNESCVRHLFLGTQKDNVHDCISKGRISCGKTHSDKVGKRKFTSIQIKKIRRMFIQGDTCKDLAASYNVSFNTIYAIIKRKTYKYVVDRMVA